MAYNYRFFRSGPQVLAEPDEDEDEHFEDNLYNEFYDEFAFENWKDWGFNRVENVEFGHCEIP